MPEAGLKDIFLYYEIHGKGTPLLLIAGLGSDSSSWAGVAKELSLRFRTIVFDNCGSGRSRSMRTACTVTAMAEDIIGLLDLLKIKQIHVVGHSMGGYIAQELTIHYPGRVGKLILESTAPVSSQRNNRLFEELYRRLEQEGYSEEWFRRWAPWLFSPRRLDDTGFIDAFVKKSVKYPFLQGPDGFKGQIDAIASFDASDRINTIKAETLILEGKDDVLVLPEEADALAKNIPGSVFQQLDGVAHSIHMEDRKLFVNAVLEFLNSKK